jgi:signal transduction histidine kinase
VLHNLLANALRYTPAGGRITVAVEPAPPEEQTSGGEPPPSRPPAAVLVSVADTGPGIPAEDLPYVFDRFYRADKSRSRAGGGSGLGLTIARSIVEAHGGRIWAESQPGQGTRIAFTIPQ